MDMATLNSYNEAFRRHTKVNYMAEDIVVNGDATKPVWKQCPSIGDLHYPWYERGKIYDTEIKMLWSSTYFYVLFDCEDENIQSVYTHYNDHVCEDSCVEIFISPDPTNLSDYYTFEINCCGVMYNKHYDYLGQREEHWYPAGVKLGRSIRRYTFKTQDDPSVKRWVIELAIPFYLFDGRTGDTPNPPVEGTVWRLNAMRCGDEIYKQWGIWSENRNDTPQFHLPQYFGEITFWGSIG